jgi:hypothetical protein
MSSVISRGYIDASTDDRKKKNDTTMNQIRLLPSYLLKKNYPLIVFGTLRKQKKEIFFLRCFYE